MTETTIKKVKVRAKIEGPGFSASTPDVISFYIKRTRGQLDTFNFSIKINITASESTGKIKIYAGKGGEGSDPPLIFTGILTSLKLRPCFEDPSKVILDGSGTDVRRLLENKQFTRRQTKGIATWVEITGLVSPGLRTTKLAQTATGDLGGQGGAFLLSTDRMNKSESGSSRNQTSNINTGNKVDSTGDSKTHTMLSATYYTE